MDPSPRGSQDDRFAELPGWELVATGLRDIAAGRDSVEAALVTIASVRLARLGIEVPVSERSSSTDELYRSVAADVGAERAHGRYNALRRRLASFLRAARDAPSG
jgi:hypothetical protein